MLSALQSPVSGFAKLMAKAGLVPSDVRGDDVLNDSFHDSRLSSSYFHLCHNFEATDRSYFGSYHRYRYCHNQQMNSECCRLRILCYSDMSIPV